MPRKRSKAGRPRSIRAETLPKLLELAKTGAHPPVIARALRIHPRTLNRFLDACDRAVNRQERGERLSKSDRELCQFCLDWWAAEAGVEQKALSIIAKSLNREGVTPREAYEFLERRWPERWSRNTKATIANERPMGPDGKPGAAKPFKLGTGVSLATMDPAKVAKVVEERGLAGLIAIPPPKKRKA